MFAQNQQTEWQQGSTVVSGTRTVILGPINLANYVNKAFTLVNVGSTTISGAEIQINPDFSGRDVRLGQGNNPGMTPSGYQGPNPALWEVLDRTSFQSLAAGGVKTVFSKGEVARWFQIAVLSNLPDGVAASGYVNATSF